MKTEFSAGGVIYKKEGDTVQFVMILNSYDSWTFPKGHIEPKEKPVEAALREVQEETGLKELETYDLIQKIDYFFKNDEATIHKYVYFYLMEEKGNGVLVAQESEVQDIAWIDIDEVPDKLTYKEDIEVFNAARRLLKLQKIPK